MAGCLEQRNVSHTFISMKVRVLRPLGYEPNELAEEAVEGAQKLGI